MENKQKKAPKVNPASMLEQKTNEDYNRKRPDPSDPNERETPPKSEAYEPAADDPELKKSGIIRDKSNEHDPYEGSE